MKAPIPAWRHWWSASGGTRIGVVSGFEDPGAAPEGWANSVFLRTEKLASPDDLVHSSTPAVLELLDVLGLPRDRTVDFTVSLGVDQLLTVASQQHMGVNDFGNLVTVLKRYRLVPPLEWEKAQAAVSFPTAADRAELAQRLRELASIMDDCKRLVSTTGNAQKTMRDAADALARSTNAPSGPREKPMSLVVALDFAENPRPKSTMQAPADTVGELREALRVLAEAHRSTNPPAASTSVQGEAMRECATCRHVALKGWEHPCVGCGQTSGDTFDKWEPRLAATTPAPACRAEPATYARAEPMRAALERIERWFGEFPETGRFWDDACTQPMSYGSAFGSNGERDYMRGIARAALAAATDGGKQA